MDWNPSILNFIEAKYEEYDEWIVKNGFWVNTAEHIIYTSKVLTDATHDFPFHSSLPSTEEPKASNIFLGYIYGELYQFIKPLPVRDKKSDSCHSIDYKPPLVSRE